MRVLITTIITLFALACLCMLAMNAWVVGSTRSKVYSDVTLLPANEVGVLLGTSPYTREGHGNKLFSHRIKAGAELYKAGRVSHLLLSGANPDATYDEPQRMFEALLEAGVPAEAMTLDDAGFRTLDSVVRAHLVFGLERFTVISQKFHVYRAVFIANHKGLDVVGFSRPEEDDRQKLRTETREFLARCKAVLDLFVLFVRPREIGAPRELGTPSPDRDRAGDSPR